MRSLAISLTSLAFVILASTFAATKPSCADTVVNTCGKFSFWVPDDWKATKEDDTPIDRLTFESPDGNLSLLVGPLAEKDADLKDEEVTDFADEELDEMKVTGDKNDTVEKFKVRLIEGTGEDEGDPVVFKMLALDPDTDDTVLAIMIYGDTRHMSKADTQATIDKILRSLRPHG
jgi:hypothetical protein